MDGHGGGDGGGGGGIRMRLLRSGRAAPFVFPSWLKSWYQYSALMVPCYLFRIKCYKCWKIIYCIDSTIQKHIGTNEIEAGVQRTFKE